MLHERLFVHQRKLCVRGDLPAAIHLFGQGGVCSDRFWGPLQNFHCLPKMYQEKCTYREREGNDRSPVRFLAHRPRYRWTSLLQCYPCVQGQRILRLSLGSSAGQTLQKHDARMFINSWIPQEEVHTSGEESGHRIIDMLCLVHLCTRNRSTHRLFGRMDQPATAR